MSEISHSPRSLVVWPASSIDWQPSSPEEVFLHGDEVHVWLASLGVASTERLSRATRLLSLDERERADRFQFERLRTRWVRARALLRRLVGAYLKCRPEEVRFDSGKHGKLRLLQPSRQDLELNVSHSGDLALFALSLDRRVGIDVETMKPLLDVRALASEVLTEREREPLDVLSGDLLRREFLCCWTRKEAWIKALGVGLAKDLQSFEVLRRNGCGQPSSNAMKAAPGWWLQDLAPCQDAVGCLAVEGDRPQVRLLEIIEDQESIRCLTAP